MQKTKVLKALFDILKDDIWVNKFKTASMCPFNSLALSIFHYIILDMSVISKYSAEMLEEWKNQDAVNTLFRMIKLNPEREFSIYFIITNIANDKHIEEINEFNSVILKYREFIKSCAADFKKNNLKREERLMIIDNENIQVVAHVLIEDKVITSSASVLKSLYKLSINEKFKNAIYFEHNIKEDLKTIMHKGNEFESMFALDLFIQLSFSEQIQKDMAKDVEIKNFIDANSPNVRIKKRLEALNWNLFKKEIKENNPAITQDQKHIMISYNTCNRDIVLKIKENLESHGYKIWIDINDIHGSSLESMANAIENSFAVLICISERYRESINCQAEAQYAFKIKKPIIPLILQKGFENVTGWLGILMGDKIFINFTKYSIEECFKRLKHEVESKLETPKENNSTQVKQIKTEDVILEKTKFKAEDMSEAECKSWFESNKLDPLILSSLGGSCSGQVLKQIWQMKQRDPQFYDQSLKSENINFFSMARYSAALEELFKNL